MMRSARSGAGADKEAESPYSYAIRLLAVRPRSSAEIADRLRRRNVDPDTVGATLDRLRGAGLLDDAAFAGAWVESRQRSSPRSSRLLTYELRQKGIGSDDLDRALAGVDDLDLARQAAAKKLRTLKGYGPAEVKARLSQFLARRGFDYDVVSTVVRGLNLGQEATDNPNEADLESTRLGWAGCTTFRSKRTAG
ncbi:MAG: regulatory protein RecX [Chloroflexota bacterium]